MASNTIKVSLDFGEIARRLRKAADALDGTTIGDRIEDGGMMGTIVRCHECGGSGQLHETDPEELERLQATPEEG